MAKPDRQYPRGYKGKKDIADAAYKEDKHKVEEQEDVPKKNDS
jgi:hypothetical protein